MPSSFFLAAVFAVGCSSTPTNADAGDAGDAGCPPGPFALSSTGDFGVPPDPNTNACPTGYCWECGVLDWQAGCNAAICLDHAPKSAEYGQCGSICDASADAATSD